MQKLPAQETYLLSPLPSENIQLVDSKLPMHVGSVSFVFVTSVTHAVVRIQTLCMFIKWEPPEFLLHIWGEVMFLGDVDAAGPRRMAGLY